MKKSLKLIACVFLFILISLPVYASEINNENIVSESYELIYDANGGNNVPLGEVITGNENIVTITKEVPQKLGYTFIGWTTNLKGSSNIYNSGDKITVDKDIVLYAKWEKTAYKISYDLKKGTQNSKNPSEYYYTSDTITLAEPTRKGYTFTGWYLVSSPKTKITQIKTGSTENIEVYASWKANRYSIKYYGNGSTSGSMTLQENLKYGVEYNLAENGFKRTGYTFVGWNTKVDGTGVSLTDEESIKNLSTTNGKVVKLYAQWKKTAYKISYDLKKGTQNSKNPSKYYYTSDTITLAEPTRKGYTFTGWYLVSSPKTKVTQIKSGSTKNIEVYASWKANRYSIKYYDNKNANIVETVIQENLKYGVEYNLEENGFKRTGYTFAGWNTNADGTGVSLTDGQTIKNLTTKAGKTVKLYAQWKANKYAVKFVYDSAEQMDSVTYKYDKNYLLPLNTYKRDGYEFAGWNTKINGKGVTYSDGQKVKNLTSTNKGTVKLYPMWKPEKPIITSITNVSYQSIQMNLDIGNTAQGYIVYRANSLNGKYAKVGTITTNTSVFSDTNLTSRKTYYYKIRSFEVNEYGIRVYSDYSDVYAHTTAEKPDFAAIITNASNHKWYFTYIDIENYGTKSMKFLSVANFYPYEGAPYTTAEIYGEDLVAPGRQTEIEYYLDSSRYFYDDSFIFTAFEYDGCAYFVQIPKTGKAIYYY